MAVNRFMHMAVGNPQAFPPLRKPCSLATKATVTETKIRESTRPSRHERVPTSLAAGLYRNMFVNKIQDYIFNQI